LWDSAFLIRGNVIAPLLYKSKKKEIIMKAIEIVKRMQVKSWRHFSLVTKGPGGLGGCWLPG
jgi:hypothetical protein